MSRDAFRSLCCVLSPYLERNEEMAFQSSSGAVSIEYQVGILLRILAGAQYHDLMMNFGLSRSTVYQCIHRVSAVILVALPLPGLPKTEEDCKNVAAAFSNSRVLSNPLKGCCGALDGIEIAIDKPRGVQNPAHYRNRKGYYALPVQAVCDSDSRFLNGSICCTGSTHDALAFSTSALSNALADVLLPRSFYLVGDEAYACALYLLTPVSACAAKLNTAANAYNYFQSSLHVHIEQSFGLLIARWRLLGTDLRYNMDLNARLIIVSMCLHNYCIDTAEKAIHDFITAEEEEEVIALLRYWTNQVKHNKPTWLDSLIAETARMPQISLPMSIFCRPSDPISCDALMSRMK